MEMSNLMEVTGTDRQDLNGERKQWEGVDGGASIHACSSVKWECLCCSQRLMNKSCGVLGTGVAQSSVLLPVSSFHPHPIPASLLFSESGIHTLAASRVRQKHSLTLPSPSTEPLPRPWLSVEPVSWITPGLSTFLVCQASLPDVAFLLKREGDVGFPEVAETDGFLELAGPDGFLGTAEARKGDKELATFLVHKPGTYSCSYLIHTSAVPSAPSDTVTIKEYGECSIPTLKSWGRQAVPGGLGPDRGQFFVGPYKTECPRFLPQDLPCLTVIPPPPVLTSSGSFTVILLMKVHRTLVCEAPLMDVEFQLRQGKRKLNLPSISTSPEQIKFYLKRSDLGDQSPFTCRYRLHSNTAWSNDSEPVELMWSDGEPHGGTADPEQGVRPEGCQKQAG